MARPGVDVGEDAAKIVSAGSDRLEVQRPEMRRHGLVGARRPGKAHLWRRIRT